MIVIFLVAVLIVVHGFQIISPVQDQSICFGREFQVTVDVGEDKIGHSVICSVPGELGVSGS